MASKSTPTIVADRYAGALMALASAQPGALDALQHDFARFTDAAMRTPELAQVVESPLLSRTQAAQAVDAVLAHLQAHTLTRRFVRVLALRRRLPLLPLVARELAERQAQEQGTVSATVTIAREVAPQEQAALAQTLADALGKPVAVDIRVNPAILGGAVVRAGTMLIDASAAGALQRLARRMTEEPVALPAASA